MSFNAPFIKFNNEREQMPQFSDRSSVWENDADGKIMHKATTYNAPFNNINIENQISNSPTTLELSPSSLSLLYLQPVAEVSSNNFDPKLVSTNLANPSDNLKKFFVAMEETVRTFHPELQIEVKAKISGLITEYELKNLRLQNGQYQNISTFKPEDALSQHPPFQGYSTSHSSQINQTEFNLNIVSNFITNLETNMNSMN